LAENAVEFGIVLGVEFTFRLIAISSLRHFFLILDGP
jgi:hypothetical protein